MVMYVLLAFLLFGGIFASACVVLVIALNKKKPPPSTTPSNQPPYQPPNRPRTILPVPDWVEEPADSRRPMYEANLKLVKAADNNRLDAVLYGDSITWKLSAEDKSTFDKHMQGLRALALGVPGDTVEELSWRIMVGKEKPKYDPRVIFVLIGINDVRQFKEKTIEKLEYLTRYLMGSFATSRIVILGLLPCSTVDVSRINAQHKSLAEKLGVEYAACGSTLNPRDTSLFADGIHPTSKGYDQILPCLRRLIDSK